MLKAVRLTLAFKKRKHNFSYIKLKRGFLEVMKSGLLILVPTHFALVRLMPSLF